MNYLKCPALPLQGRLTQMKEAGLIDEEWMRRSQWAILKEWTQIDMPTYDLFVSDVMKQRGETDDVEKG